jgi:hypothetical protein
MALELFVGPWPLFRFLILYRVGRTPWTGDQAGSLPTHRTTQTQNKYTKYRHSCWSGFEPTIPAFERAKAVHDLDRAAAVIIKFGKILSQFLFYLQGESQKTLWQSVQTCTEQDGVRRSHYSLESSWTSEHCLQKQARLYRSHPSKRGELPLYSEAMIHLQIYCVSTYKQIVEYVISFPFPGFSMPNYLSHSSSSSGKLLVPCCCKCSETCFIYFCDVCAMQTLHMSMALGWRLSLNDIVVAVSLRHRLTSVCHYTPKKWYTIFLFPFRYKQKWFWSNDITHKYWCYKNWRSSLCLIKYHSTKIRGERDVA